jgi:hypothetical protein
MMPEARTMSGFASRLRERREVTRLVRQIQALFLELEELRQREGRSPELRAKERTLERQRGRLATAARRSA